MRLGDKTKQIRKTQKKTNCRSHEKHEPSTHITDFLYSLLNDGNFINNINRKTTTKLGKINWARNQKSTLEQIVIK